MTEACFVLKEYRHPVEKQEKKEEKYQERMDKRQISKMREIARKKDKKIYHMASRLRAKTSSEKSV